MVAGAPPRPATKRCGAERSEAQHSLHEHDDVAADAHAIALDPARAPHLDALGDLQCSHPPALGERREQGAGRRSGRRVLAAAEEAPGARLATVGLPPRELEGRGPERLEQGGEGGEGGCIEAGAGESRRVGDEGDHVRDPRGDDARRQPGIRLVGGEASGTQRG